MRRLFLRIFVIFWAAQILFLILSTISILRHRGPDGNLLSFSFRQEMVRNGMNAAESFEANGCRGLSSFAQMNDLRVTLADGTNHPLCNGVIEETLGAWNEHGRDVWGGSNKAGFQWMVNVTSASGHRYVYYQHPPGMLAGYPLIKDIWNFGSAQLLLMIILGGMSTFLLILLFTRPLVRLQQAARAIANGNLQTRVKVSAGPHKRADTIRTLMLDFNAMAERLEMIVEAHKNLIRDVSHELRSPLARLSIALELAKEDSTDEAHPHLERIESETERLNLLIGELLTLSSFDVGDQPADFERLSLSFSFQNHT